MKPPLNQQQFMYHVSPASNRESIQQHGLQPSRPQEFWPKGAYLSTDPLDIPGDVYQVDMHNTPKRRDYNYGKMEGNENLVQTHRKGWKSYIAPKGVPPNKVQLVAEYARPAK